MKLANCLRASLVSMLMLSSTFANADLIISPNDRVYVDRPQYVTCQASYQPQPPYPPPYPPPYQPPPPSEFIERVMVRADIRCLQSIGPTDGRSLSRAAERCDANSPDRYRLRGGNCTLIRVHHNYRLADEIISRKTTVIHNDQIETIQLASADKLYECRFAR